MIIPSKELDGVKGADYSSWHYSLSESWVMGKIATPNCEV